MSELVPSQNEEALSRCKALYLGTSIFNSDSKKFNEARLTLSQLQESISQRYPIDGSNYVRGIQTCLSIYPSGIQMEHSSLRGPTAISALFFYPIKSLVYCGALRFVKQYHSNDDMKNSKSWKFVPLDSEMAQMDKNLRNPPLFVAFVRGYEPSTKRQIIECHVFVVGMVKTAMSLVDSCQKAFYESKVAINDFYKKYGNIPVVFCMKDDLNSRNGVTGDSRMVVKSFDLNGYHYATDQTPIDVWQLFEEGELPEANEGRSPAAVVNRAPTKKQQPGQKQLPQMPQQHPPPPPSSLSSKIKDTTTTPPSIKEGILKQPQPIGMPMPMPMPNQPPSVMSSAKSSQIVDPYEQTGNLVQVEKRVDPNTGQNIYVRYLNPDKSSRSSNNGVSQIIYKGREDGGGGGNLHDLIYSNQYDLDEECSEAFKKREYPPIIIRQEKTPSPIIVEKYVKKKAPQVIIKEIHVQEPAPPPIKVVEKMDGSQVQSIFANENKKFAPIYDQGSGSNLNLCADQMSGSINTALTRPSIQSAPGAIQPPQPPSRFRNMICHTTYETLRGEPVFPQPNNQFYLRQNNVTTAGAGVPDMFNKCATSNFNSIPVRRPLMKDINFYLNKAENQMMRHQQQQQQQQQIMQSAAHHHHHHHHHKPHSQSHRVPSNDPPNGHVVRRPAKQHPAAHLDDKRKSYMDGSNRDNCRQYNRDADKYSDDERNYQRYDQQPVSAPARPKPIRPSVNVNDQPLSPTSLPPQQQQQRQPKSILTKRPPVTATLKGEMLNRYFRGFIAEEYGYY